MKCSCNYINWGLGQEPSPHHKRPVHYEIYTKPWTLVTSGKKYGLVAGSCDPWDSMKVSCVAEWPMTTQGLGFRTVGRWLNRVLIIKTGGYRLQSFIVLTQMNKKFQVKICAKPNACWDMGDFHVISTTDALLGSHACQHNFQPFFSWEECTLSKILGFT